MTSSNNQRNQSGSTSQSSIQSTTPNPNSRVLHNVPARGNLSGRDVVMLEFQRASLEMTRNFLESQQRVMLAYLNRANTSELGAPLSASSLPSLNQTAEVYYQEQTIDYVYPTEQVKSVELREAVPPVISAQMPQAISETAASESIMPIIDPVVDTSSGKGEAAASPEQLIEALIGIVSERTGYPAEMLDPTLDLEADLGIDSIKRVEILNSFRRLLPDERQIALEEGIEKLAGVKTLQGIMDWIRTELDADNKSPKQNAHSGNTDQGIQQIEQEATDTHLTTMSA